jgi:hypothetical protein
MTGNRVLTFFFQDCRGGGIQSGVWQNFPWKGVCTSGWESEGGQYGGMSVLHKKGNGNLETWEPGNPGTWEPGNPGTWKPGKLGTWELGKLGNWEPGNPGTREPINNFQNYINFEMQIWQENLETISH